MSRVIDPHRPNHRALRPDQAGTPAAPSPGPLIESGSSSADLSAVLALLPAGTAMRIERPAPLLRPHILEYHVFDADPATHWGAGNILLPFWPTIRITFAERRAAITIGTRRYDPVPAASLHGATTHAMRLQSWGGVTIGATITPLGWSRLFAAPASTYRDRIVPLDTVFPTRSVAALYDALERSDRAAGVVPILDAFFTAALRPPIRAEEQIAALSAILLRERGPDIQAVADQLGMSPVVLRHISTRYFGFPPKVLMNRMRFLFSLGRILLAGGPAPRYELISDTYFDKSHFLRDARRFLGMTPRQLLASDNRFTIASILAHEMVIGAAERREAVPESD